MKSFVITLTAAALLVAMAPSAEACSCRMPPAPAQAMAQAGAVFSGTVTGLVRTPNGVRVDIKVTENFKGADRETLVVKTTANSAMCGFHFEEGQSYLVYASGNPAQELNVGSCSRTKGLDRASSELPELRAAMQGGQPEAPATGEPAPELQPSGQRNPGQVEPQSPTCAGCSAKGFGTEGGLVLLGLFLVLRRRR